jgi:hypothetical protein
MYGKPKTENAAVRAANPPGNRNRYQAPRVVKQLVLSIESAKNRNDENFSHRGYSERRQDLSLAICNLKLAISEMTNDQ